MPTAKIERPNKRRDLDRWRYNRRRRLACIPVRNRTVMQQERITQLESLIDWSAFRLGSP
jgi:hypothetical protein